MVAYFKDLVNLVAGTFTVIGIICGAVYAVAGDAVVPATQKYVQAQTEPIKQLRAIIIDGQISAENGKREAAQGRADQYEINAAKAASDPEKIEIMQKKRKEDETVKLIDQNIQKLQGQK